MCMECVLDCFSRRFNCVHAAHSGEGGGDRKRIECENLKYFNNFIPSQIRSVFQCQLYVEFVINVTASFIHSCIQCMLIFQMWVSSLPLQSSTKPLIHPPFILFIYLCLHFLFHSDYKPTAYAHTYYISLFLGDKI